MLLVEQNLAMAEALGDDFYLLDDGRTVRAGSMAALAAGPGAQAAVPRGMSHMAQVTKTRSWS